MVLDVFVLGPVRATADGVDLAVGGDKQRALLARLVVARGRALLPSLLIADLWEEPPRDPLHALQARVSRLRSSLPLNIELINGGYRLDPAQIRTDADRFESLRDEGAWLVDDGAFAQASDRLHEALSLWQGPAFADVSPSPALKAESARLEKFRASTVADRIDLDLTLGRSAEVIPELFGLVEEHPLFERHWGQLMTALYSTERTQEALDVFARARQLFSDRLGVEPSADLGQLHLKILQQQQPESLLRLPTPRPILQQSNDDENVRDSGGVSANSSNPDRIEAMLRRHGAILLTGVAGIGKTHLMRAMAARFAAQHCLAPLLSASHLSRSIPLGAFVGIAGSIPEERRSPAALIDFFARHRSTTVLLVDDVEELDDASLFVITHLIRSAHVAAILTTRDLAAAPEEIQALYDSNELTEFPLEPLTGTDALEAVHQILGGRLTPDTHLRMVEMSQGNPLHLREILTGTLTAGNLVRTEHGWELQGTPTPTHRLAHLVGNRFHGLDDESLEAASKVAIAGEFPIDALSESERKGLARAGVVELADSDWIRLSRVLDGELLRLRCSSLLWSELSREVVRILRGELASGRPAAQRRAHMLALDLGEAIDVDATLTLAEHALGAFDERLALRAAEAVAAVQARSVHAHRIAGLAASSLGLREEASAHLHRARKAAESPTELTAVALAQARHLGLQLHDAEAAVKVLDDVLGQPFADRESTAHLLRDRMRWAAVAGQGGQEGVAPEQARDAAAVQGLITVALSGAITGPLKDAHTVLARLQRVPDELVALVPGGAPLIELTEIMALSNTGDLMATRNRLGQMITRATSHLPETLGIPEYALAFLELFSGDVERALGMARSAVSHLEWRDAVGLLPAAQALVAAAAQSTGRTAEAHRSVAAIQESAVGDPKVVMLRSWATARTAFQRRHFDEAARALVETAQWLLTSQHTYFAGMLAHCAVRIGRSVPEAVTVLEEARAVAGGGLLHLLARHAEATLAGDEVTLDAIAREAREMGMAATAADTWRLLARSPLIAASQPRRAGQQFSADRLSKDNPCMALWSQCPEVPTPSRSRAPSDKDPHHQRFSG